MPDQPQNPGNNSGNGPGNRDEKSLREISHLFLSSIREKQTGGAQRPQRTPPAKPVDESPIDFAAEPAADETSNQLDEIGPVRAIVASHLNGHQRDRVREYAAHLCKTGERIGLIEIDAADFRLTCFELGSSTTPEQPATAQPLDVKQISESLEEMAWDIDRWLVHVPNPRLPEARTLLRKINQWTVLATGDHDGVVACYRSLKGLADLHQRDEAPATSQTLSLAVLDAEDEIETMRVFAKLAGVCQQFLHWPLESEPAVEAAGSVVEHDVLISHASSEKSASHWPIVGDFVARARGKAEAKKIERPQTPVASSEKASNEMPTEKPALRPGVALHAPDLKIPDLTILNLKLDDDATEVIDLPAGDDSSGALVSAALHGDRALVECPVKPPMLTDGALAVDRERRLVLFAVAKQGLRDFRQIGDAWRWMNENRALIAMAVPQLSIDAHQMPHLRLLIDRNDLSAETLQPLLQTANVTVQTYRKLRWGEKTGLLLEAA